MGKDRNLDLGRSATDAVTGYNGVITAFVVHLGGKCEYLITPTNIKADGTLMESQWFDSSRVVINYEAAPMQTY